MRIEWLRLVGFFKLQVSFAKEPYKRDDILQKRSVILSSLLIEATSIGMWRDKLCITIWDMIFLYNCTKTLRD